MNTPPTAEHAPATEGPQKAPTAVSDRPLVAFDILRGAAALLVMIEHCRLSIFPGFSALPGGEQTVPVKVFYLSSLLGQEAVLVFFVLSGLLVGGKVIRQAGAGRFVIRDYAIDRSTRILLPLAPAAVLAALVGVLFHGAPFDALQVAGNMFGMNGVVVDTLPFDIPLWSLAYETWFYVMAGTVALFCLRQAGAIALLAAITVVLVFCRLDASMILIWVLGALISVADARRFDVSLAVAGLVILIGGGVVIQAARLSHMAPNGGGLPIAVARGLFAGGFAMTLPWLGSERVNAFLSRSALLVRGAGFLAAISYSLYLLHYPILSIVKTYIPPQASAAESMGPFIGAITLCIGCAGLSHVLFERKTNGVRAWLRSMAKARVVARTP